MTKNVDFNSVSPAFVESMAKLTALTLEAFDQETLQKQLYYHNRWHIEGVKRRAKQIFDAIREQLSPKENPQRLEILLEFCALSHDLIQIFVTSPDFPRRREAGVSEKATIAQIKEWARDLDDITNDDLAIIEEAIMATICDYDPQEQSIYQPSLDDEKKPISVVARILALADIGSLTMEGIEAYNKEGGWLFLEENPDVRSLLDSGKLTNIMEENPTLGENIRQRLLRRAKFQVNFAHSRLKRTPQELTGLPWPNFDKLIFDVFPYLTPETGKAIADSTPTAEDTSLETLLKFFQYSSLTSPLTKGG